MATYLDFENSIKQIDEDIANAKIKGDGHAVEILEKNLNKEISKTYKNLSESRSSLRDRLCTISFKRLL